MITKLQESDKEMKKTLKTLLLGAALGIAFSYAYIPTNIPTSCEKEEVKRDSRLPEVRGNQSLILHPDYLNGTVSLGYTLLTDVDYDGEWDVAKRYHAGFTTGDGSRKIYFKKGFGPAQSMGNIEFEFVEPKFFKSYR